jgi:hypothetical protein
MATTFKYSNRKKKTPKRWRKLGNSLLVAIPFMELTIRQSPLSEEAKNWIIFITGLTFIASKFLTRWFHNDQEPYIPE